MDDSNKPDRDQRSGDSKPPLLGGGIIWGLLAFGLLLFVLLIVLQDKGTTEIPYGKLVTLIEQGSPEQNPNAKIELVEGVEDKQKTFRYSDLAKLKIGQTEITGKVTKQEIKPTSCGDVTFGVSSQASIASRSRRMCSV